MLESRRVLATYFVTTDVDDNVGVCVADDATNVACSIRSAIEAADANPGADTIRIPDGEYFIDSGNFGSFDVFAAEDLEFIGNTSDDPGAVVIDGANESRLFDLLGFGASHTVSFRGMTLRNGIARDGSGGGAIVAGADVNLSLDSVVVQGNVAAQNTFVPFQFSSGGGIQASGNVSISNSVLRDNSATDSGGGIDFVPFGSAKTLTITNTVLSGNVAGDSAFDRGVGGGVFVRGENGTAIFDRVSFDGNTAGDSGGGVYVFETGLTLTDTNFTGNEALGSDSGGGGLYLVGTGTTSPAFSIFGGSFTSNTAVQGAGGFESVDNGGVIDGTLFTMNQVTGTGSTFREGGGAIAVISTSPANSPLVTISNAMVSQNSAPSAGGIAAADANLTLSNSIITGNNATAEFVGSAGGIGAVSANGTFPLTIHHSTISNNMAVLQAGGIGAIDVDLMITDSVIDSNVAQTARAGGIGLTTENVGFTPELNASRTTVSNNQAGSTGGGIAIDDAELNLLNVTISGNASAASGGGIALANADAAGLIQFTTIASNTAPVGSNVVAQDSDVQFQATLLANGTGAASNATFNSLGNNLDQNNTMGFAAVGDLVGLDPQLGPLADNGGPVHTHAVLIGSPAIDTGPAAGPAVDARGELRPIDANGFGGAEFDIGAFENQQAVTFVVDSIDDIDDGDFSTGNLTLREAVRIANTNHSPNADTITFDADVFATPQTITLGGTELVVTETVNIIGPGESLLTIDAADSSRIFSIDAALQTVTLSGMTMENGRATEANGGAIFSNAILNVVDSRISGSTATSIDSRGYGGGIESGGTLTLTRSQVSGNFAENDGGGISASGELNLVDSNVSDNDAAAFGGGVAAFGGIVTVTNSILTGNRAALTGGAIFNAGAAMTLSETTISGNTASNGDGGGIYSDGTLDVRDSNLISNSARRGGGIRNGSGGVLTLTGTTLSLNSATYGGGLHNDANAVLTNSILTSNTASEGAGIDNGGSLTLTESRVTGNNGSEGGGIENDGMMDVVRSTISDNEASDYGGGLLNGGTLTVTDSTISGNTSLGGGGGAYNWYDGLLIINNSTISGNVASGDGGGIHSDYSDTGASGSVFINNSTIANNTADVDQNGGAGGGVSTSNGAQTTLFNTLVAGNVTGAPGSSLPDDIGNASVQGTSAFNLIGDPDSAGGLVDGNLGNLVGSGGTLIPLASIVDPTLADNGGSTFTHALTIGSPAIDAGDPAFDPNSFVPPLGFDQRGDGFARVRDGDGDLTATVDIGAFEAGFIQLSIRDVTVNEMAGLISVSVVLNTDHPGFSVDYVTSAGTATPTDDFSLVSGTLNFIGSAGEVQSFEISIIDDAVTELDEFFNVSLNNLVKNTSSDPEVDISDTAIVNILDDDTAILSVTVLDMNEDSGAIDVKVQLTGAVDAPFTFDISTHEIIGEATAEIDYQSDSQTLNFDGLNGEVQSLAITIQPDTMVEPDEAFGIEVSAIRAPGYDIQFPGFASSIEFSQFESVPGGASSFPVSYAVDLSMPANVAYLADSTGLIVYDVSNPSAVSQVGAFPLSFSAFDVVESGGIAFVAGSIDGLQVLDVADPGEIVVLDTFLIPGRSAQTVELVDTSLYLGDESSGNVVLRILDTVDPRNVQELGSFATPVEDVVVLGSVAYVAAEGDGLRILDVSNPAAITELGQFDLANAVATEVKVIGTTAYVGTSDGLLILDVSDPLAITELGSFATTDNVTDLDVHQEQGSRTLATVFDEFGELQVLDVTDPSLVNRIGFTNLGFVPLGFASEGRHVFVADLDGGMQVLESSLLEFTETQILNDDSATLTVSDVSVDETAGNANVIVTLDHAVQDGFSYQFTTNDGTAIAPDDYLVTTGSFSTGTAGEQQTITIPITADTVPEVDQDFTVSLFNVTPLGEVDASLIDATDTGTVTITEVPSADLSVAKSDSQDPALPADLLIYTLVVTNDGPSDASGVTLVDSLSNDVVFNSGVIDNDPTNVSENNGVVTANIGDLPSGATAIVTINVTIVGDAMGVITSSATVSANENDLDTSNNIDSESTTVESLLVTDDIVDLSEDDPATVLFVLDNDTVDPSGPLTITTVTPASLGTVAITGGGTTLTFTPDADAFGQDNVNYSVRSPLGQIRSANVTINLSSNNDPPVAMNDTFDAPNRNAFSIEVNDLLANDSGGPANELQLPQIVSVEQTSSAGGTVSLLGSTITYVPDPAFRGTFDTFVYTITDGFEFDTATVTIDLPPILGVDLTTSISDDRDPVAIDDLLTLTVPIANHGNDPATNVVSRTVVPVDFSIENVSVVPPASFSIMQNTITVDVGSMDAGALTTVTIDLVAGSQTGTFVTSTSVSSDQDDANPSDNAAVESTIVSTASSIFGHVYCDLDGGNTEDPGEQVVGARVFLETDGNRILDAGEISTLTDSNGDYQFDGVFDPNLSVVVEVPFACNTVPTNPGIVRSTLPVGDLARSITTYDYDFDGDRDLLVASDASNDLTVLENVDGVFSIENVIALADRPQSVFAWESPTQSLFAVAAVGTPQDGGTVFILDGDQSQIEGGNGPIDVAIDDFDGNGEPDILYGSFRSSNLQLLMNGASTPIEIATARQVRQVRTVATGDLNGDGNSDVMVGGFGYPEDVTSDFLLLLGDGAGGFSEPIVASPASRLVDLQVVDLTLDPMGGFFDGSKGGSVGFEQLIVETRVLALSEAGVLYTYDLQDGMLVEVNSLVLDSGVNAFDVGDFNRDDVTDLAVSNLGRQEINLLIGDGLGRFAPITTLTNVSAPSDIVVDDLDGDGEPDDIAVTNFYQDANLGQGEPDFYLPSATTVLRLDIAEESIIVSGSPSTRVDFAFQSANPRIRFDVNSDGLVTALDALRVINVLNRFDAEGEQGISALRSKTDINGDGRTSAVDALMIINFLANTHSEPELIEWPAAQQDDNDDEDDRLAAIDVVLAHQLDGPF